MRIIDFHNHYYPRAYIDAMRDGRHAVTITEDGEGNPVLHSPGDANTAVRGHRDIAYRQDVLDKEGVEMQVISFTSPGVHVHPVAEAVKFARMVNDEMAGIVRERGKRFTSLATLPLNDPGASITEFDRAMGDLGFRGVMVYGNVNGTALSDKRFWPLWERADQRGAVVYIHPTHPLGVEAMTDYWLLPLVGFMFDTTLAAASLVFSGVAEQFPRIKWVLGHLGGAVPYLAERFDRGYEAFPECRANIRTPPSEQLKKFYYDTVNFDPDTIQLAIRFAGADHILAGSDYPHRIGSIPKMKAVINKLPISDKDKENIFGKNTARLLGV